MADIDLGGHYSCPNMELPVEEVLALAAERHFSDLVQKARKNDPPSCPMEAVIVNANGDPLN